LQYQTPFTNSLRDAIDIAPDTLAKGDPALLQFCFLSLGFPEIILQKLLRITLSAPLFSAYFSVAVFRAAIFELPTNKWTVN